LFKIDHQLNDPENHSHAPFFSGIIKSSRNNEEVILMSTKEATLAKRVGEILYARDDQSGHIHRCAACGRLNGFMSPYTEICEACDVAMQVEGEVNACIS
jgi:uncharacterized protein with PIN domain